jgi:ATP-binding cassette subfamily F protein 3
LIRWQAVAWLENYLATQWTGTVLVVSHDRSFLNTVATDIVHMHSQRLDYYKGNFAQFYATKEERAKNQRKEYEAQQMYRAGLQAFIDRWRYNANRAAQAQSKIKILEKLPVLEAPTEEQGIRFTFQEADKLSPPILQLEDVSFSYEEGGRKILSGVDLDIGLESRLGLIGPNVRDLCSDLAGLKCVSACRALVNPPCSSSSSLSSNAPTARSTGTAA